MPDAIVGPQAVKPLPSPIIKTCEPVQWSRGERQSAAPTHPFALPYDMLSHDLAIRYDFPEPCHSVR